MSKFGFLEKLQGWFRLSRPPFHIVGAMPFVLGTFLAWRIEGVFAPEIFTLGLIAVILIMLSTYHSGEYFDVREDSISVKFHRSRFAGGSREFERGVLKRSVALYTSIIALVLAGVIGLVLQFGFRTGPYTILLGVLGMVPGFFYSTKPIRLVERGIGEIFIGFCYGWLPIATAFYLQTGYVTPIIHWMGIPVGLTIFNVILLNEFPDYKADKSSGKRNLLVRFGMDWGVAMYSAASVLSWVAMYFSLRAGVPFRVIYLYAPVMAISALIMFMIYKREYNDQKKLELLCGLTIAINIGTTTSYMLAYI